ncbi:sulfur carrier protein ThiS [Arenimonas fontis]|uniref:Sulfur carrier protein ThiS n=1 Tax=Arenimonas fontis TaxID=2608255 RepID=A0A5B2ZE06_9GAMM|nr:sulfur carrier protein ThiS [Arenimonas fontis]KAA2285282.1 sulfur carrier protein ThiS [Arenimonas fontis]
MRVLLNGEARDVPAGTTVAGLLELAGYAGRKVAVELNLAVVPRSRHAEQVLSEGDRIEVIHAIGGG